MNRGAGRGVPRRLDPERAGDYIDRLYRAAWALVGNPHDAEDLVQDTYAHILTRPRFLRRDDDLAYLLQTLRNVHANRLRTLSRRPRTADLEAQAEPISNRTSWQPEAAFEAHALFRVISTLPPDARDAVIAIDVLGLSYQEAAKAFGIPEATIATRLHRARRRVVEQVDGEAKDVDGQ